MTTTLPISQPGSAVVIYQDKTYISHNKTITIYNKDGTQAGSFPAQKQEILFLGILEASGTLIAAAGFKIQFWDLNICSFVDLTAEEDDPSPQLLREISVAHTRFACTPTHLVVATMWKVLTYEADVEHKVTSNDLRKSQRITALCPALTGFASGDEKGNISLWPSLTFEEKRVPFSQLDMPIDAIGTNEEMLYALTSCTITVFPLTTKAKEPTIYMLKFTPTAFIFQKTLIAIGPQTIFFPIENKSFAFDTPVGRMGAYQAVTNCGPIMAVTGTQGSALILSPTVSEEAESSASAAPPSGSWWSFWS